MLPTTVALLFLPAHAAPAASCLAAAPRRARTKDVVLKESGHERLGDGVETGELEVVGDARGQVAVLIAHGTAAAEIP